MQVMKYVDTLSCSPDTLRLMFSFHNARAWDPHPPSRILSTSTRLKRAIVALDVKNEIVVKIESDREDDGFEFEEFVFYIGYMKHWAVDAQGQLVTAEFKKGDTGLIQEGRRSNDVDPVDDMEAAFKGNVPDTDDDHVSTLADNGSDSSYIRETEYEFVRHRWTWTIAPATMVAKTV